MINRIETERREKMMLAPYAARAAESRGRVYDEKKCSMRTDFQRDRDRIIHSKSFRRLMHKTQVFISPEGDHYRTRLTHTIEVAQIARTIARAAGLNEDLTEAIALGHDLGHTPFGHSGEEILDRIHPGGFSHNVQSLRVVDVLENSGSRRGMNLTREVRDGILNHTGPGIPFTVEGQTVRISDRIAYINHDIDDALRAGIITEEDLPSSCISVLGDTHSKRIDTLAADMAEVICSRGTAGLSSEKHEAMEELRSFMFACVYRNEDVRHADELELISHMITYLYGYFLRRTDKLPDELKKLTGLYPDAEIVKDHIAGMTDRYASNMFSILSENEKNT